MLELLYWASLAMALPMLGSDSFHVRIRADSWLRSGGYRSVLLINHLGQFSDAEIRQRTRRIAASYASFPPAFDLPELIYLDPLATIEPYHWSVTEWSTNFETINRYWRETGKYADSSDSVRLRECTRMFCGDLLRAGVPRCVVHSLVLFMRIHKELRVVAANDKSEVR